MSSHKTMRGWKDEIRELMYEYGNVCSVADRGDTKAKTKEGEIINKVIARISSVEAETLKRAIEVVEKTKVPEIHTPDCEYQRKGCDCGYEDRFVNNRTCDFIKKSLLEEGNQEGR